MKVWFYILIMTPLLLQVEKAFAQNDHVTVLKKVVIDPGHGGPDPGALGAKVKEKDIVLDISLRVGKMINEKFPEVEVIYTRKTDVLIDLDKRGAIANKAQANLFISIHANSVASGSKCPSGADTYVMGNSKSTANMEVAKRENSVILFEDDYSTRYEGFDPKRAESYIIFQLMQNSYLNQSLDFAAEIQNQMRIAKRVDRGVKQAPFLVLWQTTMPSVLVEIGFICHPEEEKFMSSAAGKEAIASSIFQAFCSYKSKIEDRSSFRSNDHATDIDHSKTAGATDQPAQPSATAPKTQNPNSATPNEAKPETKNTKPVSQKVEFCIQISSSSKPMDTNPSNFKKLQGVERIQISANNYKYIVGRTNNYDAVQKNLKKVKADFKDAFVVSLIDGKLAPVAEGLKLITE